MKKRMGLAAGILCAIVLYFGIDAKMQEQHSIGIIGGADGPTAIFVAGKIGAVDIIFAVAVIMALIAGIVWMIRRKKK